jgi:hypothetical protein
MISTLTKEVIEGALKLIETIVYSNGKKVRRVIDLQTGLPIDIIDAQRMKAAAY